MTEFEYGDRVCPLGEYSYRGPGIIINLSTHDVNVLHFNWRDGHDGDIENAPPKYNKSKYRKSCYFYDYDDIKKFSLKDMVKNKLGD